MNRLRKISIYQSVLITLAYMVLATSAMGLIFLAPVIVYKSLKNKGYEAKAEIAAPAERVYSATVSGAEEKAPKIKIVKKEDENMFLEITDGIQTASVKVKKLDDMEKSEITVIASVPKEEGQEKEAKIAKEKELALRIVELLYTKLEVECTVKKE